MRGLSKAVTNAAEIESGESSSVRKHTNLELGFTTFGAWSLGVGALIGSMAWLIHAPMIAIAGRAGVTLAWLLSGALSVPLALILIKLSSMFPKAGGPYFYKYYTLKRLIPGLGDLLGFLTGFIVYFFDSALRTVLAPYMVPK